MAPLQAVPGSPAGIGLPSTLPASEWADELGSPASTAAAPLGPAEAAAARRSGSSERDTRHRSAKRRRRLPRRQPLGSTTIVTSGVMPEKTFTATL
jgi:hypothetical protein